MREEAEIARLRRALDWESMIWSRFRSQGILLRIRQDFRTGDMCYFLHRSDYDVRYETFRFSQSELMTIHSKRERINLFNVRANAAQKRLFPLMLTGGKEDPC